MAVGVGLDHRRVDGKAFAANQTFGDAARDRLLEQAAQKVAVAEAAVPVLGEGRMVRHRAVQAEPAKPAVRQVEVHLVAQPPLRPDAHAIADDQHPDHQLRVDRRPAGIAVIGAQLRLDVAEIYEPVDRPQEMVRRHMSFQAEPVE